MGMTPDNMPILMAGLYIGIVLLVGAIEWVWLKAKARGAKQPKWLQQVRSKMWGTG